MYKHADDASLDMAYKALNSAKQEFNNAYTDEQRSKAQDWINNIVKNITKLENRINARYKQEEQ